MLDYHTDGTIAYILTNSLVFHHFFYVGDNGQVNRMDGRGPDLLDCKQTRSFHLSRDCILILTTINVITAGNASKVERM